MKLRNGDVINIEKNLKFEILWPKEEQIQENILNNNSIVAKLKYRNFSILFTGDIEEVAENQILKEYKNIKVNENTNADTNINTDTNVFLGATILKVGHHGSKTSSTQEFIEAVNPKIALIGVGKNNNFGHPNDGVLERLEKIRSKSISYRSNGRNKYRC